MSQPQVSARSRRLRRLLFLAAVVVVGAGLGWTALSGADRLPALSIGGIVSSAEAPDAQLAVDDIDHETGDAAAPQASATAASDIASAAAPLPMPPAGSLVADWHDALAERARAGDARAACRLGAELHRCAIAAFSRQAAKDMQGDAARRDTVPDQAVDRIARIEQVSEDFGGRCEGLSADQLDRAFEWQMQAAMQRPELRVGLALNPPLDRQNFVNDIERWQQYRAVALPWLEQAARDGDVSAIIALARVFGDLRRTSPPFPPFRIADDERSLTHMELLQRYGVEMPILTRVAAETRARLDADALQRVAAEVDALHRRDLPPLDDQQGRDALGNSFARMIDPDSCE